MNEQVATPVMEKSLELPVYETPRLQVMSERDILNTFQITQSMNTWWTMGTICPCT